MLWKSLSNRPVRLKEQAIQVTGLIVWVERWITEEARALGMLNVFVVEMWDIKLTITDAQLEGNSAENVMGLNIDMRHLTVFCSFLRRNCAKVANIVSPLHALFLGGKIKVGKMGPSYPLRQPIRKQDSLRISQGRRQLYKKYGY